MAESAVTVSRIAAPQARERIHAGAYLVCAYDDPARCRALRVPGSMTFRELEKRATNVDWNQEIIFYCG